MGGSTPRPLTASMDSSMHTSSMDIARNGTQRSRTIYDMLHSQSSSEFYSTHHPLETAGCRHLSKAKQQSKRNVGMDIFDAYRTLARYSLAWRKRDGPKNDSKKRKRDENFLLPQCTTCLDPLSRLHVCLHCVFVGCWSKDHMIEHLLSERHTFAMDFNSRHLYCSECKDYVYDIELDDTSLRQVILENELGEAQAKWHRSNHVMTDGDVKAVMEYASMVSCRGIRGLCNMGNTCFMNVILQSLVHNPLLKGYFLSDRHNPSQCQSRFCLCCEMDNLFTEIYSGEVEPYGPCSFLQSMWMNLKELAGYAQQDAHEFFICVLNHLHMGCEEHTADHCRCIVHKTFAGLLQSSVTCLRCDNVTTTYDPIMDISLELRSLQKQTKSITSSSSLSSQQSDAAAPSSPSLDTNGSNGSSSSLGANPSHQSNTLADCLDRFTRPEKLGPGHYRCSKCGNTLQEATKELAIKRLPSVLSFQLKRFEHGSSTNKIETKIRFPIDLDMAPYTTKGKKRPSHYPAPSNDMYTLFAVVNHQGRMDSGHYTMFAKHRGEWFKFDDHCVSRSYQKDVLDSKAYMCFYIRKRLGYESP